MKKTLNLLLTATLMLILCPDAKTQVLTPLEELGKALFFDKIASPDNMSCATCHAPSVGFTGPIPAINKKGGVYRGAVPQRFGNRKPPSSAYATFSPIFHYDESEGLFIGGNFWDGRATGMVLGNPAADQALGPFLNPVEQNNPSKAAVLMQIAGSDYAYLWETTPQAAIQGSFDGAAILGDTKASILAGTLGANFYLTPTATSPYVGAALGYAVAATDDDNIDSISDWAGKISIGVALFRTSTTQLHLSARYLQIFAGNGAGRPSQTMIALGVAF